MTTPRIIPPHVDVDALTTGRTFAEGRKNRRLTQAQLGEMLDVHVGTVRDWESGRRPISRVVALAMAHLLASPASTWPPPIERSAWPKKEAAR